MDFLLKKPSRLNKNPFYLLGLQREHTKPILNRKTRFEEVKEKSSLYGLNMLGYTRATKLKTIGRDNVN